MFYRTLLKLTNLGVKKLALQLCYTVNIPIMQAGFKIIGAIAPPPLSPVPIYLTLTPDAEGLSSAAGLMTGSLSGLSLNKL